MSADKPKGNQFAESLAELKKHLATVQKRAAGLEKELIAEAHVETMTEARFVFDLMKMDGHVLNLRDKRNELEFLNRRARDIKGDIEVFSEDAAAGAKIRREAIEKKAAP